MKNLFTKDNMMNWGFVALGVLLLVGFGSQDAAMSGEFQSMNFLLTWAGAASLVWGAWKLIKGMND